MMMIYIYIYITCVEFEYFSPTINYFNQFTLELRFPD